MSAHFFFFFFFLHHHRASTSKVLRTDSGKSDLNRIGVHSLVSGRVSFSSRSFRVKLFICFVRRFFQSGLTGCVRFSSTILFRFFDRLPEYFMADSLFSDTEYGLGWDIRALFYGCSNAGCRMVRATAITVSQRLISREEGRSQHRQPIGLLDIAMRTFTEQQALSIDCG